LGPFQIGLQTKKEQASDALKVTREVLPSFLAQGAERSRVAGREAEFDRQLSVAPRQQSQDSGASVAMIGFYGLPLDYLDRYPENIERVTLADIKAAFARHVRPRASGDRGRRRRLDPGPEFGTHHRR
jgi:zinc protease